MSPDERRGLFPGTLELMILRVLRRGPLHGYAIVQQIKQRSDDVLDVEEGSLYPALQRLLKAGYLSAEWGISTNNRRVRVYTLTQQGQQHLVRELSSFDELSLAISRVLGGARS